LKYHLVWIPKNRKKVLNGEITKYFKEVFNRIAQEYEFEIETIGIKEDHVHIFMGATTEIFASRFGTNNEKHIGEGSI